MQELKSTLETLPFWEGLTPSEQQLMLDHSKFEYYKKGETVSHTSDTCKGAIVVLEGQIRTYIISDEGREVTLYRLYRDDICALSASCLLESIAFDVFIDAVEDSKVLLIPTNVLIALKDSNPQVELFLLRLSNKRFSDVMWTMQQILFMGADRRVAIFLRDEFSKTGSTEINMTHEEIARYIGSAREVVTRMLKYFADEGIVSLSRGKIEILDTEKLNKYV